ncbi:MAG: hypothetical protein GY874_16995 [Desulfobacteraceae bacterium]|nr:hypothetical protein [Desulfobacteraceae bacterium]
MVNRFFVIALMIFMFALCLQGCLCKDSENDYLVRAGSRTITVAEFMRTFETVREEVFAGQEHENPALLNDLRMRVLNQITEELIISEQAKTLSLTVSEDELKQAVITVKADYPEDTFQTTLLENAVSYEAWEKKLQVRLLTEKVIAAELIDQVRITSEDVAAYYKNHYPEGIAGGEKNEQAHKRIIKHLRRQKAQEAYKEWIDGLYKVYPVDINKKIWNQICRQDLEKER